MRVLTYTHKDSHIETISVLVYISARREGAVTIHETYKLLYSLLVGSADLRLSTAHYTDCTPTVCAYAHTKLYTIHA